jgi:hypothetical protein
LRGRQRRRWEQMDSSHKKGRAFEAEVKRIIEDVISKTKAEFRAKVISHKRLMGLSTEWYPDLVLTANLLFDSSKPSLELAIVECKCIDSPTEGTYWSEMSRAYMSLNDLRLVYREDVSFYLAVNRNSKSKKRDYSGIFGNIGVKLVNINIPEERSEFESKIERLLEDSTYDSQLKKLKPIFEKYR